MSNLSKETQQAIANRASEYADQQHANDGDDIHIGYLEGATEWAGRAQPVIDALQELVNLKCIKEQFGKTYEYLNNQPLAWEAATTALAKYKEVWNG